VTDRIKGFVVTLEKDLREDDAEATLTALRQIKGVLAVEPQLANIEDQLNRTRIRYELGKNILELIRSSSLAGP
jgi:hypothetical protein